MEEQPRHTPDLTRGSGWSRGKVAFIIIIILVKNPPYLAAPRCLASCRGFMLTSIATPDSVVQQEGGVPLKGLSLCPPSLLPPWGCIGEPTMPPHKGAKRGRPFKEQDAEAIKKKVAAWPEDQEDETTQALSRFPPPQDVPQPAEEDDEESIMAGDSDRSEDEGEGGDDEEEEDEDGLVDEDDEYTKGGWPGRPLVGSEAGAS